MAVNFMTKDRLADLGAPVGSDAANDWIRNSVQTNNKRLESNAALQVQRNGIIRLDNLNENMQLMTRANNYGLKGVQATILSTSDRNLAELHAISKAMKDLTEIVRLASRNSGGGGGLFGNGPRIGRRGGIGRALLTGIAGGGIIGDLVDAAFDAKDLRDATRNNPNAPAPKGPVRPSMWQRMKIGLGTGWGSGLKGGLLQALIYSAGTAGIDKLFDVLPKPNYPKGYDPDAEMNKGFFQRLKELNDRTNPDWDKTHNTGRNAAKAANEAARARLEETRRQVEAEDALKTTVTAPGAINQMSATTAQSSVEHARIAGQAVGKIIADTKEAALDQIEELDREIEEKKKKTGWFERFGNWLTGSNSTNSIPTSAGFDAMGNYTGVGSSGASSGTGGYSGNPGIGNVRSRRASGNAGYESNIPERPVITKNMDASSGAYFDPTTQTSKFTNSKALPSNQFIPTAGGAKEVSASLEGPVTRNNDGLKMSMVNYARSLGLSKEQAAGLVGNFQGESLDPNNNTGDGGKAFGLGQWHPDRQAKLQKFAEAAGMKYNTREAQIAFAAHEMGIPNPVSNKLTADQKKASGYGSEAAAGRKFLDSKTAGEAAANLTTYYERPKDKAGQSRLRAGYAEEINTKYNQLPDTKQASIVDVKAKNANDSANPAPSLFDPNPSLPSKSVNSPPNNGNANIQYSNQNATRNQALAPTLQNDLSKTVAQVYGDGYTAKVYSGGQGTKGDGTARVGSTRHDGGSAGDVYIYDPQGRRLTGDELNPLAQAWRAQGKGGVGMGMANGGIHLDEHKGRTGSWTYPGATPAQIALNQSMRKSQAEGSQFPHPVYAQKAGEETKAKIDVSTDKNLALADAGFSRHTPWGAKRDSKSAFERRDDASATNDPDSLTPAYNSTTSNITPSTIPTPPVYTAPEPPPPPALPENNSQSPTGGVNYNVAQNQPNIGTHPDDIGLVKMNTLDAF